MPTRTYAQLLSLIQALCGVTFATIELGRIKALINRRAFTAYRATNFWPRFLTIGEERHTVSNNAGAVTSVPFIATSDDDSGTSTIDTFIRIHKDRPYMSRSAQEFDFYTNFLGANLISGSLNPVTVFVTYKVTNSAQYGDSTGETTEIPLEWFQYLAHATYADYLRAEGQQEKAQLADQEAELILNEELLRIDNQRTSNMVGTKISTNSNYQMR
jgi:hypothetical protein